MQLTLDLPTAFTKEHYDYGTRTDGGAHGLVLTKTHVVELILDLAGYRSERDLASLTLLEPACGEGAFLVPAVGRLVRAANRDGVPATALGGAILAFDVESSHVEASRKAVVEVLVHHAVAPELAGQLAAGWIREGDFLLARTEARFDVVVGNPPYIRIEQLAPGLQAEYRRRFSTLFDRADLYVAFIEKSLQLLSPAGVVSFVCADRWTLNQYGSRLRALITQSFQIQSYIDLRQASPFESEVIAYPSIFVIGRERTGKPVAFACMANASPEECAGVFAAIAGNPSPTSGVTISHYETWFSGESPWVLSSPEQLAALRSLEERFPLLEKDGAASVRIGVATGSDKVYIVRAGVEIESDRLVPLVMRDDIEQGKVRDARRFVINTSGPGGALIDLKEYPRLAHYFESHREAVAKRHVARNGGPSWFRTIDRVYPELVSRPKLLIPDIAGSNQVVFEEGRFYPHHNLYFVLSDVWDLEVLGGLLSSRVALFFVWSYAVKMRGGYLRFQAQYLRRIRVPRPGSLPKDLCASIRDAYRSRDFQRIDELAIQAYGLVKVPDFDFVDTRC